MRYNDNMKIWLFDLAHGNLSDLEIIKGFIKYYVLYNCTIQNVQDRHTFSHQLRSDRRTNSTRKP